MFKDKRVLSQNTFWKKMMGTPVENLKTIIGTDLRSVALFRIFLAAVVIFDLINRASDLSAHYTDHGVLPRSLVLSHFNNDLWFSFHLMSGLPLFQGILFIIHGIFAAGMLVGYYTKFCTFMTWLLMISLHNRNILVLHGGDLLGRMLLFFANFLPLEKCYSIDNAYFGKNSRNATKKAKLISPSHYTVLSVATFTIGVQFALMYVTSFMHKTGQEWTTLRTSTWLALQLDYFRTPIGDFFLQFPEALKYLTASVLWWEGYGPLFWYIPIFSGPLKTFGTLGFAGMHFGFALCLRLGQFGVCGMFGVLVLLPTWFWEEIVMRKLRTKERLGFKLFYDPNNTFCTNVVIFCENFLLIPETQVLRRTNADEENQQQDTKKSDDVYYDHRDDSVVDIKPARSYPALNGGGWLMAQDFRGVYHTDYDAIIAICRVSPLLWPWVYVLRLKSVAKYLRPIVSKWAPVYKSPSSPSVSKLQSPSAVVFVQQFWKILKNLLLNIVCLFFLVYILTWNAGNVGYHRFGTPGSLRWIAWFFHVDQSWAMFSPRPPNVQWYYIIEGELDNGRSVELFRNEGMFNFEGSPMSWEKPDPFYKSFKNHRWFKYYENGINTHPNNDQLRLNWGRYICREFNSRHFGQERLYKFSIHWMNERAEPDKPRYLQPKQTLWNHVCYDK